jgi:aldehyde dehydrogenase (NAD+)
MTTEEQIIDIVARQREFFATGITLQYQTRIECLQKLKAGLVKYEAELHAALKQDLSKPEFEAFVAETGFCRYELTETIKKLGKWMKPRRVRTSMLVQPGTSSIHYSPLGVNLIIGPYNYPVMLTLSPLIAALAAGNTAVLKTSEMTPASSTAIQKLIEDTFDPEYVAYVPGAVEETTLLLARRFDHIFFTGSPRVGSIVMSAAAKHLTPVTLELGGKSPCIVHHDANLDIAVKRICSGKFTNAGQICVAPDYVLVHKEVKEAFLEKMKQRIIECFGEDASTSPDYGRIVNDSHFRRISAMIEPQKVVVGGVVDAARRYIAPTVLRDVHLDDKAMSEEIFGPVLPVLEYSVLDDINKVIAKLPQHPLAFYVFSESRKVQQELIAKIQFGGGCINNCVMHIVNSYLPFGGVGQSGMGAYHGFQGFERFSHKKSIFKSATWIDLPLLYAPYKDKIKLLRRIMT